MKLPDPFIGVGTGRCGSHTLNEVIKACNNVISLHEVVAIPWYSGGSHPKLGELIRRLNNDRRSGKISGEIGPCLIRQLPHLRSVFPGLKVVCMHRNKHETVRSFMEYGQRMPPLRPAEKDSWADGCLSIDHWDAGAHKAFPVIDADTREQSIGFYWEMYESMMQRIKPPVMHIRLQQINYRETVEKLFDFLEIPTRDRVYIEVRKFWSIQESRDVASIKQSKRPPWPVSSSEAKSAG